MKTSLALAAALLLAGATAASAAGMSSTAASTPATTPSTSSTGGMSAASASDSLTLTSSQQKTAWKDLKGKNKEKPPSGFTATVGSVVPGKLKIKPMTSKAASDVPALKPYDFAMVKHKLLIVNPSDRTIANVIKG